MLPLSISHHLARSFSVLLAGSALGLLLGGLVLGGCSTFSSESPPVPDSTFTKMLVELHLTAARKAQPPSVPANLRDSIFAHYNVDEDEFDASLEYYSRHPQAFESLYQTVIDSLRAAEHPPTPDSVANPRGRPTPPAPDGAPPSR